MEPTWTDQAKRVMEHAREESIRLGHGHVDTEHLLLGIIKDGAGPAVTLLMNLGLNLRIVRESIEDYVAESVGQAANGERDYAPRARRALEGAVEEAREMRKDHVGAEHLLIAMQ